MQGGRSRCSCDVHRAQYLKATQIKLFYDRNNILFLAVMSSFPCFSVNDKLIHMWSEDKLFQVWPFLASVPNTLQSSVFKGLKYVWNQIFTLCSFLSCCCCNAPRWQVISLRTPQQLSQRCFVRWTGLQWTSCGCGAAVSSAPIRAQHWPTQRPAQCWAVAMWAADECKQEGKQRVFGLVKLGADGPQR